jgi:hypothetical protein
MTLFHDSKQKLLNISRTIDNLLEGDFPISSGRTALRRLTRVFEELGRKLDRARKLNDESSEKQIATLINLKVIEVLPVLGFIIRSTNVRNAFELLDPLQVISNSILEGRPQLLLSSEWDYVPFAYPQTLEDLKSFVLIGMPASETSSALLVPLAGHSGFGNDIGPDDLVDRVGDAVPGAIDVDVAQDERDRIRACPGPKSVDRAHDRQHPRPVFRPHSSHVAFDQRWTSASEMPALLRISSSASAWKRGSGRLQGCLWRSPSRQSYSDSWSG